MRNKLWKVFTALGVVALVILSVYVLVKDWDILGHTGAFLEAARTSDKYSHRFREVSEQKDGSVLLRVNQIPYEGGQEEEVVIAFQRDHPIGTRLYTERGPLSREDAISYLRSRNYDDRILLVWAHPDEVRFWARNNPVSYLRVLID